MSSNHFIYRTIPTPSFIHGITHSASFTYIVDLHFAPVTVASSSESNLIRLLLCVAAEWFTRLIWLAAGVFLT